VLAAEAEGEFWASLEQPVEVRSGPFWAAKEAELRSKIAAFYRPISGHFLQVAAGQIQAKYFSQPGRTQAVPTSCCAGRTGPEIV
jgi:hypothetical protein